MASSFTVIKNKIAELGRIDEIRSIFGAGSHVYKNYPVSVAEIESFENRFAIRLPETFRAFLIEIGYGAAPYYGIWKLSEIELEFKSSSADLKADENILTSPANRFPFGHNDIKIFQDNFQIDETHPGLEKTYPVDGGLVIGTQGCQGYNAIAVTGELAGTVWDLYLDSTAVSFWHPARPATCLQTSNNKMLVGKYLYKEFPTIVPEKYFPEPTDFLDWYENWLDNSLLAFEELKEYNAFRIFDRLKPI